MLGGTIWVSTEVRWGREGMLRRGGGGAAVPSTPGAPSLCPATLPQTPVPASMAFVTDSNRPQPLRQPPQTAYRTASRLVSEALPMHPGGRGLTKASATGPPLHLETPNLAVLDHFLEELFKYLTRACVVHELPLHVGSQRETHLRCFTLVFWEAKSTIRCGVWDMRCTWIDFGFGHVSCTNKCGASRRGWWAAGSPSSVQRSGGKDNVFIVVLRRCCGQQCRMTGL